MDEGPLGAMTAPTPSALYPHLAAHGIRPEVVRQFNPDERTAIMETFATSLGVRCTFCHVEDNFDAPTPRIAVATAMWLKFTRGFQFRDGSPLYCDSCHHGSATFLRRDPGDHASLQALMHQYAQVLVPRGGGAMTCASCHSEPFRARFLPRWTLRPPAETPNPAASDPTAAPRGSVAPPAP